MLYTELKSNLIDSYNKKANERNSSITQNWKLEERNVFLEYIKNIEANNLLEIGAGPGKDGLFFYENGLNTFSIDLSPEMVKLCRAKGLKAEVMSFDDLNFSSHYFDSIWALNCLLHVPKNNLKDTLKEIKRVLKPSGLFYMGVYGGENFEGIWEDDHYDPKRFFSFYDDDSLVELLSEIFKIEYFNVIPSEVIGGKYHFQSFILKK